MPYLIGIAIICCVIWLIIKLIIWVAPYLATGLAIILGAGCALGLPVGIFFGFKSYISSILKNIHNGVLRIIMIGITFAAIAAFLASSVYAFIVVREDITVNNALKKVELHKNNGIQYAVRGSYDMAIEEFTKAIGTAKQDMVLAELHELRGRALIARSSSESVTMLDNKFNEIAVARPEQVPIGTVDRAISDFSTAIKLNPENPVYYRERGRAYNWRNMDDSAIADFDSAIRLNPRYAIVYNSRGLLYANRNDDVSAIEDYSRAIQIDPKFIFAYRNRGGVYARNNEFNSAIEDFDAALRLDPENAQIKWSLKQVRDAQKTHQKRQRSKRQ